MSGTDVHSKIKNKKPHCQYKLCQECGFLYLSLQCVVCRCKEQRQERTTARSRPLSTYTQNSNTGNRIPSAKCTEIVVSCGGFRGVRACYAMSGTGLAYRHRAICLRYRYAMSGTGLAYRGQA
eukprot:2934007-Rhodomonas_salina.1